PCLPSAQHPASRLPPPGRRAAARHRQVSCPGAAILRPPHNAHPAQITAPGRPSGHSPTHPGPCPPLLRSPPYAVVLIAHGKTRSEEHTSELQSRFDLVCRLLLEKKKHDTTLYATRDYHAREVQ